MSEPARFTGFISYSRADYQFARRLHRTLESFPVPQERSIFTRRRTLGRFFLDLEDFSCAGSLPKAIQTALDQSESLIVLCSPDSARSAWVEQEINYFRASHGSDRIFAAVCPGRRTPSKRTAERTEDLFPQALLLDPNDADSSTRAEPPLAADFRHEPFHKSVVRVATGLLGIPFDVLWQRARRRRRATLGVTVALSASLVLLAVLGVRAYVAQNSTSLAKAISGRVDAGDIDGALALTGHNAMLDLAHRLALEPGELRQALFKALLAGGNTGWLWFSDASGNAWVADQLEPVDDARAVVSLPSSSVDPVHLLVDVPTRTILAPLTSGDSETLQHTDVLIANELDRVLVVSREGMLSLWDTRNSHSIAILKAKPREDYARYACFHAATGRLFVAEDSGILHAYDAKTGAAIGSIAIGKNAVFEIACSATGSIFVSTSKPETLVIDAATLAMRKSLPIGTPDSFHHLYVSANGDRILGWTQSGPALARVSTERIVPLKLDENTLEVEELSASADETRFYARAMDGWYGLYDFSTGAFIKAIREGVGGWDTSTVGHFAAGGTRIVLENRKFGEVLLVDATTGKRIRKYSGNYDAPADTETGRRKTFTLYEPSAIELLNLKTGAVRSRIRVDDASVQYAVTSSNDKYLVAVLSGNRVRVWDADTLRYLLDSQVTQEIDAGPAGLEIDEDKEIIFVSTRSGTRMIDISAAPKRYETRLASSNDCDFKREDDAEEKLFEGCIEQRQVGAGALQTSPRPGDQGMGVEFESEQSRFDLQLIDAARDWAVLYHEDGGDGSLFRRNPQTGRVEKLDFDKTKGDFMRALVFEPTTHSVMALGEGRDEVVIHRIRLSDGKRTRTIHPRWETYYPYPIDAHAYGIVMDKKTGVYLWDVENDKVVFEFEDAPIMRHCSVEHFGFHNAIVFQCSESASAYARGRNAWVQVHNALTGKKLLEGPRFIRFATTKHLAITMSDPANGPVDMDLYDSRTWRKIATLNGHSGGITSFDFLNDDEWIVAATREGGVFFWDARTGAKFAERFFGQPLTLSATPVHEKSVDLLIATATRKLYRIDMKTDLQSLRTLASDLTRDYRKGERGLGRDAMLCSRKRTTKTPPECETE